MRDSLDRSNSPPSRAGSNQSNMSLGANPRDERGSLSRPHQPLQVRGYDDKSYTLVSIPTLVAEQRAQHRISRHAPPLAPLPELAPNIPPDPGLARRPSRMSLFNLFTRPKVEKSRGHHEAGLPAVLDEAVLIPPPPMPTSSPDRPAKRDTVPVPESQPRASFGRRGGGGGAGRGASGSKPSTPEGLTPPVPSPNVEDLRLVLPPLSHVYKNSIKRSTLEVPTESASSILRTPKTSRQTVPPAGQLDPSQASQVDGATARKLEKTRARPLSFVPSKLHWTRKTYVLLDSGHILQYSVEGAPDRLPEKVLHLGKESAAFACDVIPGKHWVLQVSRKAAGDGAVAESEGRSFLSRLRSHNSAAKRTATTFLLVMDSAEEMDEWLTTVRTKIEELGGMKLRPALVPRKKTRDTASDAPKAQLENWPIVTKDAGKPQPPWTHADSAKATNDLPAISTSEPALSLRSASNRSDGKTTDAAKRFSTRPSSDVPSLATTIGSHDQLQLNQLREGSRLSYMSTGTENLTVATSCCSSPAPPSPLTDTGRKSGERERSPTDVPRKQGNRNSQATSINWRQSIHSLHPSRELYSTPLPSIPSTISQRHSTYGSLESGRQQSTSRHTSAVQQGRYLASPTPEPPEQSKFRFSTGPSASDPESPTSPDIQQKQQRSSLASLASSTRSVPYQLRLPLETSSTGSQSPERRQSRAKSIQRPIPVRVSNQTLPRRVSSLSPQSSVLYQATQTKLAAQKQRQKHLSQTQPQSTPQQHHNHQRRSSDQTLHQHRNQHQRSQPVVQLRRPNSLQIRTDAAGPFLSSSSRTSQKAYTPSMTALLPLRTVATVTESSEHDGRPMRFRDGDALAAAAGARQMSSLASKRQSVPAISLFPPAPPPNVPLPLPPLMAVAASH